MSHSTRLFEYPLIFTSPPDLPFLKFWSFWNISKRYFDVFGRFSKLISLSVSAVACTWFFAVGSAFCLARKLSGEVWRGQNWCAKKVRKQYVSKKGRLPTFCGPQKLANIIFVMYLWHKLSYYGYKIMFASFWLNFKPKAGKHPPRAKCWQTYPPPNLGGSLATCFNGALRR